MRCARLGSARNQAIFGTPTNFATALPISTLLTSCSDNPPVPASKSKVVNIQASDNMKFDATEIQASRGQRGKIVFKKRWDADGFPARGSLRPDQEWPQRSAQGAKILRFLNLFAAIKT